MVKELVEIWGPPRPDNVKELIVTWVPMWEPKRKLRGFDQAELIAKEVGGRWEVETLALLERTRETEPMYGLKRSERAENVRGAFRICDQYTVISDQKSYKLPTANCKLVILVDDVWTTGATMRECITMLKQGGVSKVWALTLAR